MYKISTVTVVGLVALSSTSPSQAFAPISTLPPRFSSESAVDASSSLHARRPQRFEDDDYDYDDVDDDDDDYYFRDTRIFEQRSQSEELRNINIQLEQDDETFNDDDYFDEQKHDSLAAGNFWFNPKEGLDNLPDQERRTTRILPQSSNGVQRHQRQQRQSKDNTGGLGPSLFGSRTTFRSGTPPPPRSIKDMYDRFFWYGFDPDVEDASPEGMDKTVFGGTKGKFDGLSYLDKSDGALPQTASRRRRRRPRNMETEGEYDYLGENEDSREEDDNRISRNIEQGENLLLPRSRDQRYQPESRSTREPRDDGYFDEEEMPRQSSRSQPSITGDWVADEVAGWFDTDKSGEPEGVRGKRRDRRRDQNPFSKGITEFLDEMFKVDRSEMNDNAEAYNRQLGRGFTRIENRNQSTGQRSRAGSGRASKYERNESDYDVDEIDFTTSESNSYDVVVDVDAQFDEVQAKPSPRTTRTWEERSIAYERVPPAGVTAWGPAGDLGIDARIKATLDALEEIRDAKRKVDFKGEKETDAKEDIIILKSEIALTKQRATMEDPRRIRAQLLRIELKLEDATRFLRCARSEVQKARQDLEYLEDRHWALLSLYDADSAVQEIVETFEELEVDEPATRLKRENKGMTPDGDMYSIGVQPVD